MFQLQKRLAWLRFVLVILFCSLAVWLATRTQDTEMTETAVQQSTYTLLAGTADGTIYDRNGVPLINDTVTCTAVVSPTADAVAALMTHVLDSDAFLAQVQLGKPFVCEIDTADIDCPDVVVLENPNRYSNHQLAQHLIGYTTDGVGATGLEYAYDSVLRAETSQWRVTFTVDGTGSVLAGEPTQVRYMVQIQPSASLQRWTLLSSGSVRRQDNR